MNFRISHKAFAEFLRGLALAPKRARTIKRTHRRIGRNKPCPCGKSVKYKKCHWSEHEARG